MNIEAGAGALGGGVSITTGSGSVEDSKSGGALVLRAASDASVATSATNVGSSGSVPASAPESLRTAPLEMSQLRLATAVQQPPDRSPSLLAAVPRLWAHKCL